MDKHCNKIAETDMTKLTLLSYLKIADQILSDDNYRSHGYVRTAIKEASKFIKKIRPTPEKLNGFMEAKDLQYFKDVVAKEQGHIDWFHLCEHQVHSRKKGDETFLNEAVEICIA